MKKVKTYITDLMNEFKEDQVPLLAAAQAYYYILSVFPLLIFALTILPFLNLDPNMVMNFITRSVPPDTAALFEENITTLVQEPQGILFVVSLLGALWSASNGINAFIKSSNEAYDVEETRSFIKVRLLAIALTFSMVLTLIIAIVLPMFGNVLISFLTSLLSLPPQTELLFQVLRWAIGITVMTAMLLLLYRFAPNKTLKWKEILVGALTAALLWQVVSLGFSFYVSNFGSYSATYGSLGGVIILLLWFFLTGLVLMIGAEMNVIIHRRKTKRANQQNNTEKEAT
ncbi:YihY/virulence factor BrkB family protein [uncultured Marinococcus sp.]|jgi:membrane protein|uniref:YihY/virulence factor BrkB family protein n=1 Tax=uncultured Marinococcus sp. TaxID=487012 RepID=UPI0026372E48|nr:YihY/virulence factor BrkB family protein [uncultured Marinococcus sp.]